MCEMLILAGLDSLSPSEKVAGWAWGAGGEKKLVKFEARAQEERNLP